MASTSDIASRIKKHRSVKQSAHVRSQGRKGVQKKGVRLVDLARLTGIADSNVRVQLKKAGIDQYPDRTYNTEQAETFIRVHRGVPDFRIPDDMRGSESDRESTALQVVVVDEESAKPTMAEEMMRSEELLLYHRMKKEEATSQLALLELRRVLGELLERDTVMRTISDSLIPVRSGLEHLGGRLAGSLVGLSDEREVKERIDEVSLSLLETMQESIRELIDI